MLRASAGSAHSSLLLGKEMSAANRDEERPRLERFDGSDPASYKRWRRKAELMLLALPSTIAREKWGPKLCEFLYGEAEEVCEGIPLDKLTGDAGYKLIFETLDARYADLEQDAMQKYLNEYFFKTQIKAGETYRNLTIRLDTAYRNLQEVNVKLPEEVRGWFLLRKLALDKSSEAMVLTATSGSLKYSDVTKAIKSIFPQGRCVSTANRLKDVYAAETEGEDGTENGGGDEEEHEVFQVVADQFQGLESYDDEEALDVLETYQDIRRKLQQKKMGRGYKAAAPAWSLTGTVQGRLEQLKSKTRCHICKQTGHWKRECPKRRDHATSSSARSGSTKDTKDAMIADLGAIPEDKSEWFVPVEEIEDLDVFLVEGDRGEVDIVIAGQGETDCEQIDAVFQGGLEKSRLLSPRVFDDAPERAQSSDAYMAECSDDVECASVTTHAVPDTACRRTLIGQRVLEGLVKELGRRGLRVRYMDEKHEFKFGNAGKLRTTQCVVIPACIGDRLIALKAAVLPNAGADTPLLLSKECLRGLKATLDMERDVMYVGKFGVSIDMKETERGHYAIPILGCRVKRREVGQAVENKSDIHEVHEAVCAATPGTSSDVESCTINPVDASEHGGGSHGDGGRDGGDRRRSTLAVGYHRNAVDEGSAGCTKARVGSRESECEHPASEGAGLSRRSRRRRARRANQRKRDSEHREVRQGRDDENLQRDLHGGQELCAVGAEVRDNVPSKQQGTKSDFPDDEAALVHCDARSAEREQGATEYTVAKGGGRASLHRPGEDGKRSSASGSCCGTHSKDQGQASSEQQARSRFEQWLRDLGKGGSSSIGARAQGHQDHEREADGADAFVVCPDGGAREPGSGGMNSPGEPQSMSRQEPDTALCTMSKGERQLCRAGLNVIGDRPGKSMGQVCGDRCSKLDVLEVFQGHACSNASAVGLTAKSILRFSGKFEKHQRYFGGKMQSHVLAQLDLMCPRLLILGMPRELREMLTGNLEQDAVYCSSYNRFANAVSLSQESSGRLFAVEVGPCLKPHEKLLRRTGMYCVQLPGLGTSVMTNCKEVCERVKRGQREGQSEDSRHVHRAIANMFIAAVLDWKRARDQVVTSTCVHAVEDLRSGTGLTDQKIMVLLRKCHENLGHPSPARLNLLLKSAHASDRVLRLARGLTCEACDSLTRPKAQHVTKVRRATEFNQQVCLDTFEVEVRGSKLHFLNICDEGTSYQLCVPLWKGKQARHVRNAFRKSWKRWVGAPIRAFTDGGPEFEAEFEHGLQLDGTFGDKAAAYAPWQNGLTERKGGVWKLAFQKALLDASPRSKQEVQELVDNVNVAVNTMTRKDGYSPCQHVFGRELRVPGLISTEYDPVINSGLVQGESVFERRMVFRNAARKAFLEADGDAKLRKALEHRTRPERGPFNAGDLVYFWRRHRFENKHHWHGPAVVIGSQSSKVWIAQGTKVYRCCPEQLRRLTPEQEAVIKLLPADVVHVRSEVSARGAGTYHDISEQERPPVEESEEASAPQVVQAGAGVGDIELDVEPSVEVSSGSVASPELPGMDVEPRAPRPPLEEGEESPSKRLRVSELTQALRRSADVLDGAQHVQRQVENQVEQPQRAEDIPIPGDSDEELEVTVNSNDCLVVERTKGRKEVAMSSVAKDRSQGLDEARRKEWKKLLDSKAIVVHTGEKARQLRKRHAKIDQRTGSHRGRKWPKP